ncbi:MAG: prolyl oligopeptidase family serine peptidase [Gammaproteobacteria bacterium]|nr:prolyl oligopeptidase family serine peptidase [Gammaproteobacteria bacterium]
MTNQLTKSNKNPPPYGNWPSVISAELIVQDSISLNEPKLTANAIYYIERRPQENGRCVIVEVTSNHTTDILPESYNARSRVHEYGGGSYCVDGELLFFINDSDQDIYCRKNSQIIRITKTVNMRFADFVYDNKFQRLIAICETHEQESITNSIVSIDVNSGQVKSIEQGSDFYASPRLNSSADQLCWQSWNHPNMPWDGNQLWLADVNKQGNVIRKRHIAGANDISVFQPQWSPDDILYFISDSTGWWQLYRYHDTEPSAHIEQLTEGEKEFGLPQWVFAQSTYAFIDNSRILCCYQAQGKTTLATLSLHGQLELTPIAAPWQEYSCIAAVTNDTDSNRVCFIAASSQSFPQLIAATVDNSEPPVLSSSVIKTSCKLPVSIEHYSIAHSMSFTNRYKQKIYANFYPPTNPVCHAGENELPPLIVICHGGPTGQTNTALDPKKQFWTSRGFALLDVNYSGSTGFGRDYRLRLDNKWGQLDVEDCCDAALYAVSQGMADKNKLVIRGSSAGGYTVLSALTFQQVFSAGASYYGISELISLARDTHKFESHYLDRLIGPYPESRTLYEQRSPINYAEQLNCPVIFFQGLEDKVVPRQQAEKMFNALNKKGLPVAVQYFKGEQHGFRKAETIVLSLENELSFYQLIFNLKPAKEIHFKGDIQLKNI